MNAIFLPILLFFYNNLAFHSLGLTIIEIGIISRLILFPFLKQQLATASKMKELQPKLNELKNKHKNDKQALTAAQMALYKEQGFNPAAGCLPSIVPFILLIGLSNALNTILQTDIQTQFFIWDMAKPDTILIPAIPFALPGILVILSSASQFIYSKLLMPTPPKIRKEDKPQEKEEKADFMSSFAEAQSSMIWMFPLLFLFLGTQWPSGLALYWVVSTVFAIIQHLMLMPKKS